jgi:TolB-like protein
MVVLVAVVLYMVFGPPGGEPPEVANPMIAVLPFENLGSPEDQYFADGMTEEITSRLASIKGLGVLSRTSAVKLKESDTTLREIGREHGVDFVLEGSVRWSKVGGQHKVRITPQLIRVSDDRHMWADNYEQAMIEVFAVQAEIAEKIVEQLGVTLVEKDRQNLASRPTENPEAYQYYLKALKELRGGSDYSNSMAAQTALDSAVALDPSFALAHALRSEAYSHGAYGGPDSRYAIITLEAAKRSLELQPGLSQGHYALGNYYNIVDNDFEQALEQFSLAKAGLDNDPELLEAISYVQSRQGKGEEAVRNRRKAAELDPLNARRHAKLAGALQDLRRFEEAEESINRAIALEPEVQSYYESKIGCLIAWYGDIEKVKPVISKALEYCDTTEFVIKNSWATRYVPELQTHSVIAKYISMAGADRTVGDLLRDRRIVYSQHIDIVEDYEDEARRWVEEYDGSDSFISWWGLLFSFAGECDQAIKLGLEYKASVGECVSCVPARSMLMARIYANCGRYDEAITELEAVLSLDTYVTVNTLKYKHWIDPFRDDARFLALNQKYD